MIFFSCAFLKKDVKAKRIFIALASIEKICCRHQDGVQVKQIKICGRGDAARPKGGASVTIRVARFLGTMYQSKVKINQTTTQLSNSRKIYPMVVKYFK
jgi:hypothetical protein